MKLLSDINIHFENKRASRIFFVFIWLMYALVYMTKNCFSGALSSIVDEGALTLTEASWIIASFYIAYTPLQILGGIWADKYSPEKLITIGLVGSAVSNVVIFFNQNFYVMLISWVFSAIIQFALWPAVFKIVSSQLVRSDRAKMIFFMQFASAGGLVMAYGMSAILPDWRYNFAISAIVLAVLAVALQILCFKLNPIIVKDKIPVITKDVDPNDDPGRGMTKFAIFLSSGFFMIIPAVVFKTMVENSSKTLSPTMLSQSYESISPSIGNILNILIIIAGACGTLLLKTLIFPKHIKNEFVCFIVILGVTLPFVVALRFVGDLPVWIIVLALCFVCMLLSSTGYLTQHYNMNFVKYGLNGTAAGILNAAASLAFMIQYCAFGPIAENLGWPTVTTLWIVMVALSMVFVAVGIRPYVRFLKKTYK